jgi:hypothetical protein
MDGSYAGASTCMSSPLLYLIIITAGAQLSGYTRNASKLGFASTGGASLGYSAGPGMQGRIAYLAVQAVKTV